MISWSIKRYAIFTRVLKMYLLTKPLPIDTDSSVIHPGAQGKYAGLNWPIFEIHQELLMTVLPVLVKTHHSIAFYDHRYHETNDEIGMAIKTDMKEMVFVLSSIMNMNFKLRLKHVNSISIIGP